MRSKQFLGAVAVLLAMLVGDAAAQDEYVRVIFDGRPILMPVTIYNRGVSKRWKLVHRKFRENQVILEYRPQTDERCFIQDVFDVPSPEAQFRKMCEEGESAGADKLLEAAAWAIKRARLDDFDAALQLALKADPNNQKAKQLARYRKTLEEDLGDSSAQQKYLKEFLATDMKFKESKHYVLAYDTDEDRADERLELLEKVYETFLLFFATKGRALPRPQEHMMVVLFSEHQDYEDFSVKMSPELKMAAGYYSPSKNVAVFYAQGTHPVYKELLEYGKQLRQTLEEARRKNRERNTRVVNLAEIRRMSDTVNLLVKVQLENEDVEVVSHEATHQIASNAGLFPRQIRVPSWVQEGLAAYFEAPQDASWSGVGTVNELRLKYYRALQTDAEHSNIDFIVSDDIYSLAATHGSILHAYGQAWALTHFLIEKHFDELDKFWRILARLPADTVFGEEILERCFNEAFGTERDKLDTQWRGHMNALKTETEKFAKEE